MTQKGLNPHLYLGRRLNGFDLRGGGADVRGSNGPIVAYGDSDASPRPSGGLERLRKLETLQTTRRCQVIRTFSIFCGDRPLGPPAPPGPTAY